MPPDQPQFGDFTPQAADYAAARPHYPPGMWDLLIADAGVRAGDAVIDFGAGTGISSAALAQRGMHVIALEPNAAMRRQALVHPDIVWRDGTFERSGLDDECGMWAVAAQAFHWADPARALPEIRRVLRPKGRFTVLWNDRDASASPLLRQVMAIIHEIVPGFDEAYRARDWPAILQSTGDFHDERGFVVRHDVPMSPARFMQLWRSHNRLSVSAGAAMPVLLQRIERLLIAGGHHLIDVPYVCRAWSVARR